MPFGNSIYMKTRFPILLKLVILFLLMSLIPVIIVSTIAYQSSKANLQQTIGDNLANNASEKMDKIDRLLFFCKEEIQSWVQNDIMQDVIAGDPDGRITSNLIRLKEGYGIYSGLFCLDSEGTIVGTSESNAIGQNVADAPWFHQVVKNKRLTIGLKTDNEFTNDISVFFAIPIISEFDNENTTIGYLSSFLSDRELYIITNYGYTGEENSRSSLLLDTVGSIISGSSFILENDVEMNDIGLMASRFESKQRTSNGKKKIFVESNRSGDKILIGISASEGYKDFKGLGWSMITIQNLTEAFAPIALLRNKFISFSFGAILVACILAVLTSRTISEPICELNRVAAKIAAGDLNQTVLVKSTDEIGELADSFNLMTEEVRRARSKIFAQMEELREALCAEENLRDNAEQANRAKSEFLANMSHELRTPLNSILGFSQIMLDDHLTSEHRDYLEMINNSSDNLLELINNILDLSKIEADQIDLETIPFDLEAIIYDCSDTIRSELENKKIELLVDVGDIHSNVFGDPTRIRQVLINFLGNALKFTDQGEIILSLQPVNEDKETIKIRFSVEDTGIGMTEKQRGLIFDAFKQADGSTTRKYGGTGLGLSISKQLTELMGADLQVESEIGKGSKFFFELRFDKAPSKPVSTEKSSNKSLKDMSCLIIDDNPVALQITQQIVTRIGLKSTLAKSADEGIEKFTNNSGIEIILLDLMMPEVDGFTFVNNLKKMFQDRPVKIIALSPVISSANIRKIKDLDIDGYLFKPLRQSSLVTMIQSLYNENQTKRPATAFSVRGDIQSDVFSGKILIVEDNLVNRKVAGKMMERMGHHVSFADDGILGIEAATNAVFDIIFMDMQMPNLGGVEATREIRNRNITTPIVAMTANAMKGDREICIEAGMDDYISKPIKRDIVRNMILKFCGQEQDQSSSDTPRILIVDDNSKMSEMLLELLQQHLPFAVFKTANDGIEACEHLGSFHPQVIITDLAMPNMDGLAVLKFIKKDERYKDTQIIVMTGLKHDDSKFVEVEKLGVLSIFHKPFDMQAMTEKVKLAVRKMHM